jgi:hypothetical protein
MLIAIMSDIHDNIPNLKKVLDYCASNKVEKIICLGDLASLETLEYLNENFGGEIFFTFGNMDNDYLQNYYFKNNEFKKTKIFKKEGKLEINGRKIGFAHFPRIAKGMCRTGKFDKVFYGHTHKPWVSSASEEASADQGKECLILNPGNVAGQFFPATFAVWNTENDKFELVRIDIL